MDIIDLIFPKSCVGCGKTGIYLCNECLKEVRVAAAFCPKCAKPSIDAMVHFKCATPLGLDGIVSIWKYKGVVRKALIKLKYRYVSDLAKELSQHASYYLKKEKLAFTGKTIMVPIPLHDKRKNWRGFNQSEILGKLIAKQFGWKFIPNLLRRKRITTPQTSLKVKPRLRNLLGAFSVDKKLFGQLPNKKYQLIIFDDVWTTGSTLKEAAKVLKKNKVEKVWGMTIAS